MQLPQELIEAYELGELFAADYDGVLRWVVRRWGEWYMGPILGPSFADAATSWQPYTGYSGVWA